VVYYIHQGEGKPLHQTLAERLKMKKYEIYQTVTHNYSPDTGKWKTAPAYLVLVDGVSTGVVYNKKGWAAYDIKEMKKKEKEQS